MILLLDTCEVWSQPMLAIIPIESGVQVYNPDSIMIDTNSMSSSMGEIYSKRGYTITFSQHIFSKSTDYTDTVKYLSWEDIDSNYLSVRLRFQELHSKFGLYSLSHYDDSFRPRSRLYKTSYFLLFSSNVNVDSVLNFINSSSAVYAKFNHRSTPLARIPNDRGLTIGTSWESMVWDRDALRNNNYNFTFWPTDFHRLGWLWNHYQQKTTMAWEITEGNSSIVINDANDLYGGEPNLNDPPIASTHPDMSNYLNITNPGDGNVTNNGLHNGHALSVQSCAVANGNNDGIGRGIIGSCPSCRTTDIDIELIPNTDVDGLSNGVFTHPDIVTFSIGNNTEWIVDRISVLDVIDSGIVVVAAAGNHRDDARQNFPWSNRVDYTNATGERVTLFTHTPVYPAAYAFTDRNNPNNPNRDFRVISVGGTYSGRYVGNLCQDWAYGPPQSRPHWIGDEQFPATFAFGPGKLKFDITTNPAVRINRKEQDYMDIVVPTGRIAAIDGAANSDAFFLKYHPLHQGTSQAAPSLAGVIGLMMSINPKLGINLDTDNDGIIDNGAAVQRMAYDILTFTTDKIQDALNYRIDEFHPLWDANRLIRFNDRNPDGSAIDFHYVLQPNDPLQRSHAQRVGFGRLNSYRAVAHAIANKSAFLYTTSTNLFPFPLTGNGNVNERGENLMHMGAWFDATNRVLAVGGHTIPGTDPTHRNQGRTVINGTNTVLTVQGTIDPGNHQQNSVLAIDGILTTDIPAGNNWIETGSGGKILITGYLDNVAIKGNTRISDLIMNADAMPAVAGISIGVPSTTSEVYGHVTMRTRSHFTVDQGTMVMQPGSVISMMGNNHIEVRDGGVLDMRSASKIEGNNPMKMVFVRNGSRFIVRQGAKVDLNCFVQVDNGGEFIVEAGAEVTLDRFRVHRGGKFVLNTNSRLIMNTPQTSYCYGIFEASGCREITSHVAACCEAFCEDNDNRARIMFADAFMNPLDATRCYLQLANTRVENVRMRTMNYPILGGTISNVTFVGERSIASPIGAGPLLQMQYSLPLGLVDAHPTINRQNIIVQACHFEDPQVPVDQNNINTPRSLGLTPMSGILAINLPQLTIVGSTFENLATGVHGTGHNVLRVNTSTFTMCGRGVHNRLSAGDICNNTFTRTEMPVFYDGSFVGKAFDNRMTESYYGFDLATSGRQDLRGNILNNFRVGVHVTDRGSANLDQLDPTITGGSWEIDGRNKFDVNTTVSPETPLNPNGTFFPPDPLAPVVHADIAFDAASKVSMKCGYNFMSEFTPFHLYGLTPGVPSTMDKQGSVDYNMFSDPNTPNGFIRLFNVNAHGRTLNAWLTTPPQCAPLTRGYGYCFAAGVDEWMSWPGGCRVTIAFNDGSWVSLPPGHPLLDTAFTFARRNMRDYTVSYSCRRTSAYDAVQAALLGDAAAQEVDSLLADFGQMITDTATPDPLRTSVMLLKGELHERKGEFTDALNTWGTIVSSYPTSADSIPAAWRIQALEAYLADTAQEYTYDSLMLAYHNRALTDQRKLPLMPLPKRMVEPTTGSKPASIEAMTLTQNRPNPFSDDTDITFTIPSDSHVLLTVLDGQGAVVATLVNEPRAAGNYTINFPAGGLPSGTYIYRLSAAGRELSRTMQIVR